MKTLGEEDVSNGILQNELEQKTNRDEGSVSQDDEGCLNGVKGMGIHELHLSMSRIW